MTNTLNTFHLNYPLSEFQREFWRIANKMGQKDPFVYTTVFHITGDIDIEKLRSSIAQSTFLISPNLCSYLKETNNHIHGVIQPEKKIELRFTEQDPSTNMSEKIISDIQNNPRVSILTGPLIAFDLVHIKNKEYFFAIQAHHCIFDSSIISRCFNFIENNYNAINNLIITKKEYTKNINAFIKAQFNLVKKSEGFSWQQYTEKVDEYLNAPFIKKLTSNSEVAEIFKEVPLSESKAINFLARKNGATLHIFYILIFVIILYKISGKNKCIIEVPINVKKGNDAKFYGNYLRFFPLMIKLHPDKSFSENLRLLVSSIKEVRKNRNHIDSIYQDQNLKDYYAQSNIRICVNQSIKNVPLIKLNNTFSKHILTKSSGMMVDIKLNHESSPIGTNLYFNYKSKVLCKVQMDFVFHHISLLSTRIVSNQDLILDDYKIGHAPIHGATILNKINFFDEIFLENSSHYANALAYLDDKSSLSYKDIGNEVEGYVKYFSNIKKQYPSNPIVLLYLDCNLSMLSLMVSLISIKSPFLIVSKKEPRKRLHYYIKDSKAVFIVSDINQNFLPQNLWKIEELNKSRKIYLYIYKKYTLNQISFLEENTAYLSYTSGSTGNPKGVKVSYHNLFNLLSYFKKNFFFQNGKYLVLSSPGFDIYILEILLPYVCHATLLNPKKFKDNFVNLGKFIDKFKPDFVQATPSYWRQIIGKIKKHKNFTILSGGEQLDEELKTHLFKLSEKIYNVYGPTETTIWSTCTPLFRNKNADISTPIDNTILYVLNKRNEPIPPGFQGELFIAGDGVSLGYTVEKSNCNRFVNLALPDTKKTRILFGFKTGDRVYLSKNNKIYYQGRDDGLVKINGVRADLNEIRLAILAIKFVVNAEILFREEENYLAGFFVIEKSISHENARILLLKALRQLLPAYLIPSEFIFLESLPLNSHGKVDKDELSKFFTKNNSQNIDEENECNVYHTIRKVLGRKKLDTSLSFFEQGGTSFNATVLIDRIIKVFSIQLNLDEVMQTTKVSSLITLIKTKKERSRSFDQHIITPRDRIEITILSCLEAVVPKINSPCVYKHTEIDEMFLPKILSYFHDSFGCKITAAQFNSMKNISSLADFFRKNCFFTRDPIVFFKRENQSNNYLALVHGLGGNVWRYFELSRLIEHPINIIGLEAPGLSSEKLPYSSMNDLITCYDIHLKKLNINKITLLGWCMGTSIADELASKLMDRGIFVRVFYINPSPTQIFSRHRMSPIYPHIVNAVYNGFKDNITSYRKDDMLEKRFGISLSAMIMQLKIIFHSGRYENDKNFYFYYKNHYFIRMLKVHYFNLKILWKNENKKYNLSIKKTIFLTKDCFLYLNVKDDEIIDFLKQNDNIENHFTLPGNHFTALQGEAARMIANKLNESFMLD